MDINNDLTNTFGFYGHGGVGPGNHLNNEFVTSENFSKLANVLNKISWITAYSEESDEPHVSSFYGNIIFRAIDTTTSALLDSSYSNYGINLEYDSPSATTVNDVFNSTTDMFEIPLQDDLLIGNIPPYFRVEAIFNSSSLHKYRASFMGLCCDFDSYINIALFDCESGVQFTETEYAALTDYDLQLFLFGYRPVNVAVL